MIKPHNECLMREEWAKLWEHNKTDNEVFLSYMRSQSEINAVQAATLQKLMHRIYGNAEDGILSDIRSNKQSADSNVTRIEESMKRLWWAFGIIISLIVGNILLVVKLIIK